MLHILFAGLLEPRFRLQIVVAIGQTETAGAKTRQPPRRFVGILLAAERERGVHDDVVQLGHHRLQGADVASRVYFGEPWFDGIHATGIDARLVHARAVVVADDLFGASFGRVPV